MAHPTRNAKGSRWALNVNITALHESIARIGVKSQRYSYMDELSTIVTLQPLGINVRSTILKSVATLLIVGTDERQCFDLLSDLVAAGRAPEPKDGSVVGATCHEFDTAGLEGAT